MDATESNQDLMVTPQSIDFGSLSHGQVAAAKLSVRGGPGSITALSDHLKISPSSFFPEGGDIEVTLLGGSSGELVWDDIILKTHAQEVKVPVTARWRFLELESTVDVQIIPTPSLPSERLPKEERTFKGRACSRCGRNFAYDTDLMSWEKCTCSWHQVIRNMSVRIYKDLFYGAKDLPSYVQEIWRVILGKEKW